MKNLEAAMIARRIYEQLEPGDNLIKVFDRIENHVIQIAMAESADHCKKAADKLGLLRTTLVEKRRKYGLPMNQWKRVWE